ncbi:MAG: hypothetical protein R3B09_26860 [Nannocystaceae bacterium]
MHYTLFLRIGRFPRALALTAALSACSGGQVEPTASDTAGSGSATTTDGDTETTGDDACLAPEGCFACPPETPEQLLNACSDASCEPFVNDRTRLPLLNEDGSLPPLP